MHRSSIRLLAFVALAVFLDTTSLPGAAPVAPSSPDADTLAAEFSSPPMSARPRVFWFWMGKNISREGITADLDAMRDAGIGGLIHMAIPDSVGSWDTFEIANSPTPENRMLGDNWWKLLAFAVNEAGRRDMFFDLHVCPGYATCGGPWITPENSMQLLTFSEVEIDAADAKPVKLPRPPIKQVPCRFYKNMLYDTKGFYRDVGVVAVPKDDEGGKPDLTRGIDVSRHLRADGTFDWRPASPGRWVVYRIGRHSSGRCIHPCPPEALGLEADKWSDGAIDVTYRAFTGKLRDMIDAHGHRGLRAVHIDSYEAGPQNWTATFRDDFRQRRGYDPLPFLPLLAVDRRKLTDPRARRFLHDFDRTTTELFAERMVGHTAELAHRDGLLFSCEPYGRGIEPTEMIPQIDLPMCEFWNGPPGQWISLPAAYAGKTLVGAEAFTCFPQYPGAKLDAVPMTFIPRAHGAFARGVNLLYFHSYAHQPFPDHVAPGMTMGQWGTQISRKTTWWSQSRPFFDYLARCQYLLQQGVRVVDELRMQYCPTSVLLNDLSVRDGRVVTPGGSAFAWIQLTGDRSMRLDVARRLERLIAAGAVVVGPKPNDALGLEGYPASVDEVRRIADEVWGPCDGKNVRRHTHGQGMVLWNEEPAKAIPGYVPDIEITQTAPGARFEATHRRTPEADIYFIANLTPNDESCLCRFRVTGRQPELWDAADGSIHKAKSWRMGLHQTDVALQLEGDDAVFVVFRTPATGPGPGIQPVATAKRPSGPVTKALYGLWGTKKIVDVRDQLNGRIARGQIRLLVGHALGVDPALYKVKELHITHTTPDGQIEQIVAKDGDTIMLPSARRKALLEVDGAWQVAFPPGRGAPERITLPRLANLSEHERPGVKYFSGTATYRTTFSLSKEQLAEFPSPVVLDLGAVCDVVTVRLNGQELGILWRPPYRIDATRLLQPGENRLELDVTNTWVNRLIGDQQEPDDCTWYPDQHWGGENIGGPLRAFPDWFVDYLATGNRPSKGRRTFVFWNKYKKDSPLPPSGLLGPVRFVEAQPN